VLPRLQLARVQAEDGQQQVVLRLAGGVQRLVVRQPGGRAGRQGVSAGAAAGGRCLGRGRQQADLRSRLNHTSAALLPGAAWQAAAISRRRCCLVWAVA
jgi:hypothetical protein